MNSQSNGYAHPPRVCLCCHRPPETMERDLLYACQGLKDTTKDAEPVEDHLPASIHQGASTLHSDEDMEDKIKLLDPRVQKLIRTYLEVFRELNYPLQPPVTSWYRWTSSCIPGSWVPRYAGDLIRLLKSRLMR